MDGKRRLAYSLLLVGLAFVAALHAVLAVAFGTGLEQVSALAAVVALVLLAVVNL